MNLEHYWDLVIRYGTKAGLMIIAALILWIVGRLLIRLVDKLLKTVMDKQNIDPTLTRYAVNVVNVALNVTLVVAILGYFGVQTTTFAALIAGAGVALGLAWSGLLANFAAGAFLVILRPYKVGDFVQINDTMGTVEEIGLFFTGINTLNNDRIYHGNAKVLGGTIENYSSNAYRRVELKCQLASDVDHVHASDLLRQNLAKIPNVLSDPAPLVEIFEFTDIGPKLAVFPFCNNAHYWQVYWDTNRVIRETMIQGGFPYGLAKQVWIDQQGTPKA